MRGAKRRERAERNVRDDIGRRDDDDGMTAMERCRESERARREGREARTRRTGGGRSPTRGRSSLRPRGPPRRPLCPGGRTRAKVSGASSIPFFRGERISPARRASGRGFRRREKSLRNGVHIANGVVWEAVSSRRRFVARSIDHCHGARHSRGCVGHRPSRRVASRPSLPPRAFSARAIAPRRASSPAARVSLSRSIPIPRPFDGWERRNDRGERALPARDRARRGRGIARRWSRRSLPIARGVLRDPTPSSTARPSTRRRAIAPRRARREETDGAGTRRREKTIELELITPSLPPLWSSDPPSKAQTPHRRPSWASHPTSPRLCTPPPRPRRSRARTRPRRRATRVSRRRR